MLAIGTAAARDAESVSGLSGESVQEHAHFSDRLYVAATLSDGDALLERLHGCTVIAERRLCFSKQLVSRRIVPIVRQSRLQMFDRLLETLSLEVFAGQPETQQRIVAAAREHCLERLDQTHSSIAPVSAGEQDEQGEQLQPA